jgi:sec-independent protein translocase protein TatA
MGFVRGIGPMELIIILVIVMIIFGVGRLTEIGSVLGRSIREFRNSVQGDDSTASENESEDDSSQQKVGPGSLQ